MTSRKKRGFPAYYLYFSELYLPFFAMTTSNESDFLGCSVEQKFIFDPTVSNVINIIVVNKQTNWLTKGRGCRSSNSQNPGNLVYVHQIETSCKQTIK